jgi:polyisoprenoid-binding protein YceI
MDFINGTPDANFPEVVTRKIFLTLLLLTIMLGASAVAANAQTYVADDGYVEFVSTAPLLEFKGKSNHLTGMIDLEENLVDFYVDLTTLDTGINLRNNHMRDSYLETDDYPFAEFTGSLVSPYDPQKGGKQEVVAAGKFKIHGVEREIEIPGMLEKTADGLHLKASWTLLLEDYDIRRPQVVFYELAQEQDVSISITLKRE